jgi:D-alanyl-D-alanine carboxypeptidase/D-alanyl-D-alanine-endopeptidase (penicillin-binding protein 4)
MAPIINCQEPPKQQRSERFSFILFAVLVITVLHITPTEGSGTVTIFQNSGLITNGSFLVRSTQKTIGYREDDTFLPASTLKLLTSLAAFDLLTPEFKFETHFYVDDKKNLYIKGYGDPFLTSEEILQICSSLKKKGVNTVHTVFLDDSSFSLHNYTPGASNTTNPYDAPNGALAVNFNTLAIQKRSDGTILSSEPQTPTLPIMQLLAEELSVGVHRINVKKATKVDQLSMSLQYVGELFCAKMKQAGITVKGGFQSRRVPLSLHALYVHQNSKTLQEVMRECLHYSNNFIANQVFLYSGLKTSGEPATWNKSRKFMSDYLTTVLGLTPQHISVQDGSGLSRHNKISANALVTILEQFRPYSSLLNNHDGALFKSGTLEGVYCYGGYFTADQEIVPFAILLNQKKNTRDEILRRLYTLYNSQ